MSFVRDANVLDELLAQLNLRARIAFRGILCERWAVGGSRQGRIGFHLVLSGSSWLRLPQMRVPIELTTGGLLLYRADASHLLSEEPARNLPVSAVAGGASVGLLCGYFESGSAHIPIMDSVPAYLVWRNTDAFPEPLASLARALVACALEEKRSSENTILRISELLMLGILREPQVLNCERLGVVRARRDPVLRRVFDAIHARPGRKWTLVSLARSAGVSRSAFAARFKQQVEISAMHYVRRYRLALAEKRMREDGLTLAEAARATGYGSAAALRRAARSR